MDPSECINISEAEESLFSPLLVEKVGGDVEGNQMTRDALLCIENKQKVDWSLCIYLSLFLQTGIVPCLPSIHKSNPLSSGEANLEKRAR
jgi:hypothetical protein